MSVVSINEPISLNESNADVREAAYKGLVRPILEYGSSVWDPHYEGLIDDLEKVQKRAARFVIDSIFSSVFR